MVLQGFRPGGAIRIIPAIKGGTRNADLFQRAPNRQGGTLNEPDDLKLLGCGVSHSSSPPSAIMLFLRRRSSSACSATTSFSSRVSRRRSLPSTLSPAPPASPPTLHLPS